MAVLEALSPSLPMSVRLQLLFLWFFQSHPGALLFPWLLSLWIVQNEGAAVEGKRKKEKGKGREGIGVGAAITQLLQVGRRAGQALLAAQHFQGMKQESQERVLGESSAAGCGCCSRGAVVSLVWLSHRIWPHLGFREAEFRGICGDGLDLSRNCFAGRVDKPWDSSSGQRCRHRPWRCSGTNGCDTLGQG